LWPKPFICGIRISVCLAFLNSTINVVRRGVDGKDRQVIGAGVGEVMCSSGFYYDNVAGRDRGDLSFKLASPVPD
jgi:hypothetical protein